MAEFDGYAEDYDRLLKESVAASGEEPAYFADYKARYIAEKVAQHPKIKILDFGCGSGNVASALARRLPEATVHGYDPSRASLERIDAGLRARGCFTADTDSLDDDYDVALMAGVLHHVTPEERAGTLAQVAARLGAGGRLAVFEHNPANPLTRRAVDSCPFDKNAALLPAAETVVLVAEEMIFLRRAYIVFFPRLLRMARPLESWLEWCPMGAQYVVVGQRKP